MSMSEPFLPAHEPRHEPDPREHDIDAEADVFIEPTGTHVSPMEADLVHTDARLPPFRTPIPGDALRPDELADELTADNLADDGSLRPSDSRPNDVPGSHD